MSENYNKPAKKPFLEMDKSVEARIFAAGTMFIIAFLNTAVWREVLGVICIFLLLQKELPPEKKIWNYAIATITGPFIGPIFWNILTFHIPNTSFIIIACPFLLGAVWLLRRPSLTPVIVLITADIFIIFFILYKYLGPMPAEADKAMLAILAFCAGSIYFLITAFKKFRAQNGQVLTQEIHDEL